MKKIVLLLVLVLLVGVHPAFCINLDDNPSDGYLDVEDGALGTVVTGLVKGTGTAYNAAAYLDIVGLWNGGACSGYLKSDGTCDAVSGGSYSTDVNTMLGSADNATILTNIGAESATSNDIDPDRLFGDTDDDDTIDAALIPDLSSLYESAGVNVPLSTFEAAGDLVVGSGPGAVTRIAKGGNNTLFGVNNSGTLGFYDTITTVYSASFASDDSYSGTVTALTAGESIAQWDIVYIKNKSGVAAAYKYDADGADKDYPPMAVAVAAVSADASGTFLLSGYVRNDGWGWTTNQDEGKKVYASTTAGAITLTEPATDNVAIGRVVEEGVVHFDFWTAGAATGSGKLVKATAPQITLKQFNRDTLSDTSSPHTVIAAEVSGTVINNYSSSAAASEYDLPAAATGYHFILILGLAQNVTIDPNGSDVMYLNGVALTAGEAIVNTSPTVGESITCFTFQTGASSWAWSCKTSDADFAEETP